MKNELSYERLMFLLQHPTDEMISTGASEIYASAEVIYVSRQAPEHIFSAMLKVAIEQAEA